MVRYVCGSTLSLLFVFLLFFCHHLPADALTVLSCFAPSFETGRTSGVCFLPVPLNTWQVTPRNLYCHLPFCPLPSSWKHVHKRISTQNFSRDCIHEGTRDDLTIMEFEKSWDCWKANRATGFQTCKTSRGRQMVGSLCLVMMSEVSLGQVSKLTARKSKDGGGHRWIYPLSGWVFVCF